MLSEPGGSVPGGAVPLVSMFEVVGEGPESFDLREARVQAIAEISHLVRLFREGGKCYAAIKSMSSDPKGGLSDRSDLRLADNVARTEQVLDNLDLILRDEFYSVERSILLRVLNPRLSGVDAYRESVEDGGGTTSSGSSRSNKWPSAGRMSP